MTITVTEFKKNLSKFLLLSLEEDIYITKNGKLISKLSNPYQDRIELAKSLYGILPSDLPCEEILEERLNSL